MRLLKAPETQYKSQLDALVSDILAGTAASFVEIPWLTDFLYESIFHDCDFVAYHADSFKDWGFSDEGIRDYHSPDHIEITDKLRIEEGRAYIASLEDNDTYSMFDPGFFDFQVQATSGETVTVVIGFFGMGQLGTCFHFMGGFAGGTTLELVNDLGYFTIEQLNSFEDAWILENWRKD